MKTILTLVLLLIPTISFWYNYDWSEYNIYVPENIEYMEYCYMSSQCEVPEYTQKLIHVNMLLIKKGLNPIY